MSADNWTVCPRCVAKDPFINQRNMEAQTLREDYEFYMTSDGHFTASYRAHCKSCGFSHTLEHEEDVVVS
jgi:hypothetical protein